LNLLAFQFHTLLELGDEERRKARGSAGRRDMFFTTCRQLCGMPYMKGGEIFYFLCVVRTSSMMGGGGAENC
jgi:hypothetical protein